MFKKDGLTLYAVVPPPFIAPDYALLVSDTHGRSYNIVTEEGRFSELVREIGHSIATEYCLTYHTPSDRHTSRKVELKINYDRPEQQRPIYRVPGSWRQRGPASTCPKKARPSDHKQSGTGLTQLSFQWWNGAIPLIAILALLALSRAGLQVQPARRLEAIVGELHRTHNPYSDIQAAAAERAARPAAPPPQRAPGAAAPLRNGQADFITVNPVAPLPAEYSLLKDENLAGTRQGRRPGGPHASVSRAHARIQLAPQRHVSASGPELDQRHVSQQSAGPWGGGAGPRQRSTFG